MPPAALAGTGVADTANTAAARIGTRTRIARTTALDVERSAAADALPSAGAVAVDVDGAALAATDAGIAVAAPERPVKTSVPAALPRALTSGCRKRRRASCSATTLAPTC